MQLHVMAAALAAAGLVAGCGFAPTKPPQPDLGRRIPVNTAAPYIGSWPPRMAATPPPTVPASVPQEVASVEVTRRVEPITAAAPAAPSIGEAARDEPPIVWPAVLTFRSDDRLITKVGDSKMQHVSFRWPPQTSPSMDGDNRQSEAAPETLASSKPPASEVVTVDVTDKQSENTELAPSPEPEETAPAARMWTAAPGVTLSDLIREWALQEHWTVQWDSDTDFAIEAPFSIEAPDFLTAADKVFKAYLDAGCAFGIVAYSNNVLVVKTPRSCRT